MKYNIWIEGVLDTGMEGCPLPASLLGEVEAETFQEACDKIALEKRLLGLYNPDHRTIWGCRMFDNEIDARKSFG